MGSYTCICKEGFFGHGTDCTGSLQARLRTRMSFNREKNSSEFDYNYFYWAYAALGVSVKSVYLVAGRLGFYSQSGHRVTIAKPRKWRTLISKNDSHERLQN